MNTDSYCQDKVAADNALDHFKYLYNQQITDSIFDMFSDRIKTLMTQEKTTEAMHHLYDGCGEMQSYEYNKQKGDLLFYTTHFEKATLTLVVGINTDQKLTNFRFVPYMPEDDTNKEKSNITLNTPTGKLYGTLTVPETKEKVPVVLIIAGSGPTDRKGNNKLGVYANSYKMLADSLLKANIACLRYDKRGVGESKDAVTDEAKVTFDDMVNDAVGFIDLLKADQRFSEVTVLGHSEGSLIGMMASQKAKVDKFISLSGIAENAATIILKQIDKQSPELTEKTKVILDSLSKGFMVKHIDTDLATLFRPSVQPYLISWLKYVPEKEIRKLKIPVLILQGTTDIQVDTTEAEKLKTACPHASLELIEGMNHVLKYAPADRQKNIATYTKPELPLCLGLMIAIEDFIIPKIK